MAGTWGTLVYFHHQWAQAFQEMASCTEPVLETGSLESHTIGLGDPVSSKEYFRPAYIKDTYQASSTVPLINRL